MSEAQCVGCIVGLAVGDALGYPAEFRKRQQILQEIGPDGISEFIALQDPRFTRPFFVGPEHPPGTYTDDTQMTIAVAEALLQAGDRDLDALMKEMAIRFVQWSQSAQNNRAPGGTCMEGCGNLAKGLSWREAGVAGSKGCGSAMRVAPIGLYYRDIDKVAEVARASSLLTHGHDAAVEGAAAAACMVTLALQGASPEDIYSEIDRRCSPNSPDFAATWKRLPEFVQQPPDDVLVEAALGEGWVAEEAVASAAYCFWRHPDDYVAAVLTAVNTDGDSDSLATITGSLLGARLGIESIPDGWRHGVEESQYLHTLGQRLLQR